MTLPGRSPDYMSPRDYAEFICETHRRAGKPFTNELVKELAIELEAYVTKIPLEIAEKYIRLFDPEKKRKERKKKKETISKKKTPLSKSKRRKSLLDDPKTLDKVCEITVLGTGKIERNSSLKSASTPKIPDKLPERKEMGLSQEKSGTEKTPGMGIYRDLLPETTFKLQVRDEKILIAIYHNSVARIAQKNLEQKYFISKSAFYRRIRKLENYGLIHRIPETNILELLIDPSFQKSSPIFVRVSQPPSPIFEEARKTAPISEQGQEVQDSSSGPSPIPVPFSPVGPESREKSETQTTFPSKFSPKAEYKPKKGEFDEKILRSHNYYFKIPIQRKPANLDFMLNQATWFECKQMKNWRYWRGELQHIGIEGIIQLNPNVISVWLNNIWGRNPHENDLEANRRIITIKAYLEDQYPGLYLAPAQFLRRVENTGKQQAWVHHHLALKAKQQNITLKGLHWEIDSSKDMPELEAFNSLQASEHLSNELEDFDYRAEKDISFIDLHQTQQESVNTLKKTNEIQKDTVDQLNFLYTGQLTQVQLVIGALEQSGQLLEKFRNIEEKIQDISYIRPGKKSLSPLQELIRDLIRKYPGLVRNQISKKFNIKRGSVNGTVFRLKRRGLILEEDHKLFPKKEA